MTHSGPCTSVRIDHRFRSRLVIDLVTLQIALDILFAAGMYGFMRSEIQANLASAHASYRTIGQMLMPIVGVLSVLHIAMTTVLVPTLMYVRFRRILQHPEVGESHQP